MGAALESSVGCGTKFSAGGVTILGAETKFSWNVTNGALSYISQRSMLLGSELPLKASCSKKIAC